MVEDSISSTIIGSDAVLCNQVDNNSDAAWAPSKYNSTNNKSL